MAEVQAEAAQCGNSDARLGGKCESVLIEEARLFLHFLGARNFLCTGGVTERVKVQIADSVFVFHGMFP